jgi:hypothetical protein
MVIKNGFLRKYVSCVIYFLLALSNRDADITGFQRRSVASARFCCHIREDGIPLNPTAFDPVPRTEATRSSTNSGVTWIPRCCCNGRKSNLRVKKRHLLASSSSSYGEYSRTGVRHHVWRRIQQIPRLVQSNSNFQALHKLCVVQSSTDTYIKPWLQLSIVLLFYIFHMTVFTQNAMPFPVQLFPNERGKLLLFILCVMYIFVTTKYLSEILYDFRMAVDF